MTSSPPLSPTDASLLKPWLLGRHESNSTIMPRILLLDGGVSTHLESQGASFAHRALWSSSLLLDDPDGRIVAGHRDWLQHGHVNLISTVTYQCHYHASQWPDVIQSETHMDDLWRHAVALAQQAVQQQQQQHQQQQNNRYHGIVASSGCFGACLANGAEYTGDYGADCTPAVLQHFHKRKLQVIQTLPVHAAAMETIPSLAECQAIATLFVPAERTASPLVVLPLHMACWISLSCRNGHELNDGTPVAQALQVLEQIPVEAVQAFGFNCCRAQDLPKLLNILMQHYQQHPSSRGIILYPNSGETWNAATQDWAAGTATSNMAQHLMTCIHQVETAAAAAGIAVPRIIVGGCCRTTPTMLASLRSLVDAHLASNEKAECE